MQGFEPDVGDSGLENVALFVLLLDPVEELLHLFRKPLGGGGFEVDSLCPFLLRCDDHRAVFVVSPVANFDATVGVSPGRE